MSLKECFGGAEKKRLLYLNTTHDAELLNQCIQAFMDARKVIQQVALFSDNEDLEDVVTSELRFLLTDYYIADLMQKRRGDLDRKQLLDQVLIHYKSFLRLCIAYDVVMSSELKHVEDVLNDELETQASVSNVAELNPASLREEKIRRYKREKALQSVLAISELETVQSEEQQRDIELVKIELAVSQSIQDINSISMELTLLSNMPSPEHTTQSSETDSLSRSRAKDIDWRLDINESSSLLDQSGKVLRPFVITAKRQDIRNSIFRPDHSLPTMSIDEYLESERLSGGIPNSQVQNSRNDVSREAPNTEVEDAEEEAERKKAIHWDEFTEANPKGIGNTMNRG